MLVTLVRYQAITGDVMTASTLVSARIEEATDLLEERLDRKLRQDTYTEQLWPDRAGVVYPRAVPIVSATGYTIDGWTLRGASTWPLDVLVDWPPDRPRPVLVTYTGGWVERTANPGDPAALPIVLERAIAEAAHQLAPTSGPAWLSEVPTGATSVRLGDAAVSFGGSGWSPSSGISWPRAVDAYAHRVLGSV